MTRLFTFTISHFAEKARWSLDYKGIPYQEKRLVPGSHIPIVKRIAPSTFVPVLQDAGRIIQGSSAIIDYVDEHTPEPPLTPVDPSERQRTLELERWLDREFGERVRRIFYFHALNHRDLAIFLFNQGGPWWGRLFCRVGFRMIANRIRQMYEITAENLALDMDRVTDAYERLDTLLENRRYLVGDRFSRADLTLAALATPMWRPPSTRRISHRTSSIRMKSKPSGLVSRRRAPANTCCVCIASTGYRSLAPQLEPLRRRRS